MCLKIGVHLDIQISYSKICIKHLFFQNFQLPFKGGCFFLAVLMKNNVDTLILGLHEAKK